MKKIILILCFLLIAIPCFGNPYLVCDTQPNVDHYIVILDGVSEEVPYREIEINGEAKVELKDMAGIAEGNHTVEIYAVNVWGQSSPVPFSFTKELPDTPTNIGLK
jgi:hypothetical protein